MIRKTLGWAWTALPPLTLAAAAGWMILLHDRQQIDAVAAGPPVLTIQRIQTLSQLTTLRIEVADARLTQLRGRTGGVAAVLVIRGQVTIGIDLMSARFVQIDSAHHRAVLVLPQPCMQQIALDQERTRLVGVWPTGLWQIVPGGQEADTAAVNLAYRDAQRAVSATAQDPLLLDRSREQAQTVLRTFLQALGWDVSIRWQS